MQLASEITMQPTIHIKRIYDEPTAHDGIRIFVDRLWARGVKKEAAHIDYWAKVLTPSTELRKRLHSGQSTIEEFAQLYRDELESRHEEIAEYLEQIPKGAWTLITASKDLERGHSAVLKMFLLDWLRNNS